MRMLASVTVPPDEEEDTGTYPHARRSSARHAVRTLTPDELCGRARRRADAPLPWWTRDCGQLRTRTALPITIHCGTFAVPPASILDTRTESEVSLPLST